VWVKPLLERIERVLGRVVHPKKAGRKPERREKRAQK
jgi:hypothetical protein